MTIPTVRTDDQALTGLASGDPGTVTAGDPGLDARLAAWAATERAALDAQGREALR
ncbi:hypothetical protein GCM10022243_49150 [Saccharothrix violaceirubra]|uniref:Uncharacterized protein n=1 Tax=Saccharothrix violaceirubra TaxID=413306 RepID=A0A7W7SZC4_9PSEU|nr:hypothetical protein [Saccharothrix violaceirubra]MBB4963741.1 hypothetical protein [Saccharothrix violaceirubra]